MFISMWAMFYLAGSGGGVSRASSRLAVNAVHLAVNDLKDEDIYNIKIENRKMLNIQNYVVKHTKGALPWADVHSFFYFLLSIFHFWGSHVRPLFCSSWVGSSTKGSKDWNVAHVWSDGLSRRPGLWRRKGSTWSYGPFQGPKMENDNNDYGKLWSFHMIGNQKRRGLKKGGIFRSLQTRV